ncbi:MAG: excisionase family DNA binding protein [Candidatus Binatia bacterium]|jgi:excisionase family DNA binding protein
MSSNADEILTVDEVARLLKLKPQTVYKWAQEGQIPGTKLGREWRFRKSILDEWIDTSIALTEGGFDLMFRSSVLATRTHSLSSEAMDKLIDEAMS